MSIIGGVNVTNSFNPSSTVYTDSVFTACRRCLQCNATFDRHDRGDLAMWGHCPACWYLKLRIDNMKYRLASNSVERCGTPWMPLSESQATLLGLVCGKDNESRWKWERKGRRSTSRSRSPFQRQRQRQLCNVCLVRRHACQLLLLRFRWPVGDCEQ